MGIMSIAGKVAVVTGAAGDQGFATSELFAREGAVVVMTDIRPEVGDRFKLLRSQIPGLRGFGVVHDITDPQASVDLAQRVVDEFRRIDILAHIAGVVQNAARAEDLSLDEWNRVMTINLMAPWLVSKSVIPHMRKQNWGRIVLIGSYYGRHGVAFFPAYCASKAGVINLAASMALEVADSKITVNSVSPGMIKGTMHDNALRKEAAQRGITFEQMRDTEWNKTPLKEAGDPKDIAHAVLFLASEEAKYITGASLDVNGGVLTR